jgi:hypothetical protein
MYDLLVIAASTYGIVAGVFGLSWLWRSVSMSWYESRAVRRFNRYLCDWEVPLLVAWCPDRDMVCGLVRVVHPWGNSYTVCNELRPLWSSLDASDGVAKLAEWLSEGGCPDV